VQLEFNEPVEVTAGNLRVYDAQGERIDDGTVARPENSPVTVAVPIARDARDGVYTATYRVVSADGHPVSGGFAFTIGDPPLDAARTAPTVAGLLERDEAGPAVEVVSGIARGLHYAALLLLIGTVGLLAVTWPRAGVATRWPRRLLVAAAAIGLLSSLVALSMQGLLATGSGIERAVSGTTLDSALDSNTGIAWVARAGLWAAMLAVLAAVQAPRPRAVLLGVAAGAITVSLPLAGHAETQSPRAVLVPADLLHVLAAGLWLGGLVLLITLYWPRRRGPLDPHATAATVAFSRVALPAMAVLVTAGAVQTWFYLDGLDSFLDGAYGIGLVAKIGLLVAVTALAAGNRRRVQRLAEAAEVVGSRLRTAMRAEVALAVLVLAATVVVARSEPPAALAAGPSISELDLGPMRLEMWIEPARSGPNDFHLYFFDRRTGAQIERVEEVTVRLAKPDEDIPPIQFEIPLKNAAHYELLDQPVGITGTWHVRVTARVSEFDAYTATTQVELREP
jgi:copper transport protein